MKHKLKKKITIRDVAREAQVSIGTVSNSLNRPEHIHPDTLSKVRKAIVHLNFVPSPSARSRLRRQHPKAIERSDDAIGILLLGIGDLRWMSNEAPIYAYVLHGVEQAATQTGRPCQILHAADLESLSGISRYLPKGGVILLSRIDTPSFPENFSMPPTVKIMGLPNTMWGDCCTYSNYDCGRLAAEYLYGAGCRHLACIGSNEYGMMGLRRYSCESTFIKLGGSICPSPEEVPLVRNRTADETAIMEFTRQVFRTAPRTDGLSLSADVLAPMVYRSLAKLGIRPGADVRIVTCNNERPYLGDLDPQPAVVDIHGEMVGAEAVKLLLWRREHPEEVRRTVMIEPSLVMPAERRPVSV